MSVGSVNKGNSSGMGAVRSPIVSTMPGGVIKPLKKIAKP